MRSNDRSRFPWLMCCALFTLLWIGAAFDVSARNNASVVKAAPSSVAFVVDNTSLTDRSGGWRSTPTQSPDDLVLSAYDDDAGDELALPAPIALRLRHPRFDVPIGIMLPVPVKPATPLPRPPDLA